MIDDGNKVPWCNMVQYNKARPRALVCHWMAFHGKLSTRERLKWFGIVHDSSCVLYNTKEESLNHLFFKCSKIRPIWKEILNWLELDHRPQQWGEELDWLITVTKGKG